MRCNNICLNNSQGHPGKEGPSGEKGHMVRFISSSPHLELAFLFTFLFPCVVLVHTDLNKTFCINVSLDNARTVGACVYCNYVCY